MTNLELQFKNKIMRRVYATWFLKKLFSISFLRVFLMLVVVLEFAREVSVIDVVYNIPGQSFYSGYSYFTFAFSHTELSVQLYLTSILIIAIWFIADNLASKIELFKINGSRLS